MLVLPAIDIRRGCSVRLYQGRQDQETVYSKDPIEMAKFWKSKGAKMIHVADLDGAFEGKPINLSLITLMRKEIEIPLQVGGGYRDMASIEAALNAGIDKVILGTVAVYNPDLVLQAVEEYGSFISVSIDVSDDYVTVAGWKELSAVRFVDLANRMRDLGVSELLFTDTRKDGTLTGPNIQVIRTFLDTAQVSVIVSGGITTLEDVQALKELQPQGLKGVVIGKALYDKKIALEEALRVAES